MQLSDEKYNSFINKVKKSFGLDLSKVEKRAVLKNLKQGSNDLKFQTAEECVNDFLNTDWTSQKANQFVSAFTINETYFFRHKENFENLEKEILPQLVQKGNLNIWSAAASSGEEAYSLAILLNEKYPYVKSKIYATDIDPEVIAKAKKGEYTTWSFREDAIKYRAKYFAQVAENSYKLNCDIMAKVDFSLLNLNDKLYRNPNLKELDIIFCRNVLIYFSLEDARAIIKRLHKALKLGGYLFVSAPEGGFIPKGYFETIYTKNGFYYKKINKKAIEPKKVIEEVRLNKTIPVLKKKKEIVQKIDLYDKAMKLFDKREYDNSLGIISKKVQKNKKDYILMTKLYANLGLLEKGLEFCEKIFHLDKLNIVGHSLYGNICYELGRLDDAKKSFETVVFLDYKNILANFKLGNIANEQNKKQQAIHHFKNTKNLLSKEPSDKEIKDSEGMTVAVLNKIINGFIN